METSDSAQKEDMDGHATLPLELWHIIFGQVKAREWPIVARTCFLWRDCIRALGGDRALRITDDWVDRRIQKGRLGPSEWNLWDKPFEWTDRRATWAAVTHNVDLLLHMKGRGIEVPVMSLLLAFQGDEAIETFQGLRAAGYEWEDTVLLTGAVCASAKGFTRLLGHDFKRTRMAWITAAAVGRTDVLDVLHKRYKEQMAAQDRATKEGRDARKMIKRNHRALMTKCQSIAHANANGWLTRTYDHYTVRPKARAGQPRGYHRRESSLEDEWIKWTAAHKQAFVRDPKGHLVAVLAQVTYTSHRASQGLERLALYGEPTHCASPYLSQDARTMWATLHRVDRMLRTTGRKTHRR